MSSRNVSLLRHIIFPFFFFHSCQLFCLSINSISYYCNISTLSCLQHTGRNSLSSVQFSHSVMFDSSWPHELQHTRPPCPTPTPGAYPSSFLLSQWCHPTISSSVVSFSSCPQSFQASGSFQMSQLFTSDGQSIGVSAPASVLPMNTQDWSPLEWTGWISL